MFNFCTSMSVAMSVYYRVVSLLSDSLKSLVVVEAYQNGREQGLCIWDLGKNKCAYFSRHKNSDDIVVYVGRNSFAGISDELYSTKKYFKTVDEAATYIITSLNFAHE